MRLGRSADLVVLFAVWGALVLLFGETSAGFLTVATLGSVANRIPALMVTATGMTLLMVTGGIDLSVGSVLGFCGAMVGVVMVNFGWGLPAAIACAVALGLALGAVNGLVSVKLRLPSFIVTLGMLEIARGLAFLATHSQTKYIGAGIEGIGTPIAGWIVSPAFLLAVLIVVLGQVILSYTVFGRHLIAIGANREAAGISGIPIDAPRVWVHAITGGLAGLAAVFNCSRLGAADPNAGVGFELSVIAAVVVGGTSLLGGRGSVAKTFLGVLIVATLEAGLVQIGASEPIKRIVTGVVIVTAVLADSWRRKP